MTLLFIILIFLDGVSVGVFVASANPKTEVRAFLSIMLFALLAVGIGVRLLEIA